MFLKSGSSLLSSRLSTCWHKNQPKRKMGPRHKEGKKKDTRNRSLKVSHSPSFLEGKEYRQYYYIEKYWQSEMIFRNFYFISEYSQLMIFFCFQVYSKVIPLYIYTSLFFFSFFSHLGYYSIVSRVPCDIQEVLVGYLFLNRAVCTALQLILIPNSRSGLHPTRPPW